MTNPLHAVFSLPPDDLPRDRFEEWYAGHIDDILTIPGIDSARLYRLTPSVGATRSPAVYAYAALYEIGDDPATVLPTLGAALGTDAVPLPDFFGSVRWAIFNLAPIDEVGEKDTLDCDELYLVFSAPPEGITREEYDAWYVEHVRENVRIGELGGARRWSVEAAVVDPVLPPHATHLASYELTAGAARMNELLDSNIANGVIVLPPWFPQISFASAAAAALAPRVSSSTAPTR